MNPMLCGDADPTKLGPYIRDPEWWIQQKVNGHRLLVHLVDGEVTAIGRYGQRRADRLPRGVLKELAVFKRGEWYLDGELLDKTFWLFDLGVPDTSYAERWTKFEAFVNNTWQPGRAVRLLPTARTEMEKARLVKQLRKGKAEGAILRHVDGLYLSSSQGKRSDRVLKAKFWKDIDCIVHEIGVDGKANLAVKVFNESGEDVHIGSCKQENRLLHVKVGDVVQVRYLYTESGRLVQAHMECVRDDKAPWECTVDQLVYTDKHTIHV